MASYAKEHALRMMAPDDRAKTEARLTRTLRADIEAISRMARRLGVREGATEGTRHELEDEMARLQRDINSRGLRYYLGPNSVVYYHPALKRCSCGYGAAIVEDIYEQDAWMVRCSECFARTPSTKGRLRDLITGWNRGVRTECSRMLSQPLTAKDMSEYGAGKLLEAITKDAASEWLQGMRSSGRPSRESAWFFEGAGAAETILRKRV